MAKVYQDKSINKPGKRAYVDQSQFPRLSLEKSLRLALAINNDFAGRGGTPFAVAEALDLKPTGSQWRSLCSASLGYGLTEGGAWAKEVMLTALGRRCVAPTIEGDDAVAKIEAILYPEIMGNFFKRYNGAKFPQDKIAENVLIEMGIPKERASEYRAILHENGIFTEIIRKIKSDMFVVLDAVNNPSRLDVKPSFKDSGTDEENELADRHNETDDGTPERPSTPEINNRVFISHGKNKKIVDQLKELLTFGKFIPVVSIEKETTSIPVPDKVFTDMRSCSAAVIHVSQEGELMDPEGNKQIKLNENVLIEIGAAMALYDKKFVLLVQKGVTLPSNLQGLYRCEYEGDKLDGDATMKLLKTFNEFK